MAATLIATLFMGGGRVYADTLAESAARLAAAEAATQPKPDGGPTTKREPVVALVLSLVFPGLGQLYNGPTETTKGVVMLAVAGATLGMMVAGSSGDCEIDENFDIDCGNDALMTVGAIGYFANYVYSAVDAPLRAKAINRERGLALDIRPETVAGKRTMRAAATYTVGF